VGPLSLRFLTGPRAGQQFTFPGPRVRIGRSRDNDLKLPDSSSPGSSGYHAEACFENGSWWIVDLDSTNGTLVNDVAVARQQIRHGDRFAFGNEVVEARLGFSRRFTAALVAAASMLAVAAAVTLWPRPDGFEHAAAFAARTTYLIAVERPPDRLIVGTAFAIRADGLLATNAHVAAELLRRDAIGPKAGAVAVRSDTPNEPPMPVLAARLHPNWRPGTIQDDVALLVVASQTRLEVLALADAARIAGMRRGTPLAAFGFPAASTDPRNPRGRLSIDYLGDFRDGRYIGVGLGISPGTSGSPIFTNDGAVVGIVAGGDFVERPDGSVIATGSGANWGIAAPALKELLDAAK
jgi:S1-C subfamily serine protease